MLEILFVLLASPIAFFTATLLHELSHAFVIWIQGGTVTSFKVWPMYGTDKRILWGQIKYRGFLNQRIICISPLIKNILMIFLSVIFVFELSMLFKIFFLELMVFEFLEVVDWTSQYKRKIVGSDGGDFRLIGEIDWTE